MQNLTVDMGNDGYKVNASCPWMVMSFALSLAAFLSRFPLADLAQR